MFTTLPTITTCHAVHQNSGGSLLHASSSDCIKIHNILWHLWTTTVARSTLPLEVGLLLMSACSPLCPLLLIPTLKGLMSNEIMISTLCECSPCWKSSQVTVVVYIIHITRLLHLHHSCMNSHHWKPKSFFK